MIQQNCIQLDLEYQIEDSETIQQMETIDLESNDYYSLGKRKMGGNQPSTMI